MISNRLQQVGYVLLGLVVGIALVVVCTFVYLNFVAPKEESFTANEDSSGGTQVDHKSESFQDESGGQNAQFSEMDFVELRFQSRADRAASLYNHLGNADVDFVIRFLKQAQHIDPLILRDEVQEASIRRLAQLDPDRAMSEVNKMARSAQRSMMNVVFQEWSVKNLDAAIDRLSSLSEENQKNALEGILLSRHDLAGSFVQEVAQERGHEQLIADRRAMLSASEAIEDPVAAWTEFLIDHGGDVTNFSRAQSALLTHIVDSWVKQGRSSHLATEINFALQTSTAVVPAVQMFLESWVQADPSAALAAASAIEDLEIKTQMVKAVASAWIDLDPIAVLDAIELLSPDLQDWSKQEALEKLGETFPAEAAKRLEILSGEEIKGEVALIIVDNWARLDPEAAHTWVSSHSGIQEFRWTLLSRLVEIIARLDPEQAMKWALAEQTNKQQRGAGLEVSVVQSVAQQGDIEGAMSLAAQARDPENKQWSYVRIGNALVYRGRIDDALELLEDIPDRFHSIYHEQIAAGWVTIEPDIAFEKLKSLPSREMQEAAARWLFFRNSNTSMFTKEQIRSLKEYLPEMLRHHIE